MVASPPTAADTASGNASIVSEAPLSQLGRGGCGRVARVLGDSTEAVRLRALGFCEGRRVEVLRTGPTWIVRVLGSRIGISHELANSVLLNAA